MFFREHLVIACLASRSEITSISRSALLCITSYKHPIHKSKDTKVLKQRWWVTLLQPTYSEFTLKSYISWEPSQFTPSNLTFLSALQITSPPEQFAILWRHHFPAITKVCFTRWRANRFCWEVVLHLYCPFHLIEIHRVFVKNKSTTYVFHWIHASEFGLLKRQYLLRVSEAKMKEKKIGQCPVYCNRNQ